MKRQNNKPAGFRLAIELPKDQQPVIEREAKKHGSAGAFVMSLIDDRQKLKRLTLVEWLRAMPEGVDGKTPQSGTLTITLRLFDWMALCESAIHENTTMDEVASDILSQSDDLMARSNP